MGIQMAIVTQLQKTYPQNTNENTDFGLYRASIDSSRGLFEPFQNQATIEKNHF